MFKKYLILCCVVLFSTSLLAIEYELDEFLDDSSNSRFGVMTIDSKSYFLAGFSPNFSFGMFEVGPDIKLYIPLGDYGAPEGLDWVTIRHIGFDYNDKFGLKYGRIKRLTLGQGLLVDNYDSGTSLVSEFSFNQAAILGYLTVLDTKITALQTVENVQALRIERPLFSVIDTPIVVGGTFAQDKDGIDENYGGEIVTRPEQQGYAVDVSYPIGGEILTLFTEYSKLENYGEGASLGLKGSLADIISYKMEYRQFGKEFVPGYFNSTYQSISFNLAEDSLDETIDGVLVNIGSNFMGDFIKAGIQYEVYDDVNVLTGAVGWKRLGPVTGVINYAQPFNAVDNNAVVTADFYYRTGKFYDVIIRARRVYETPSDFTQSYEVGAAFNFF